MNILIVTNMYPNPDSINAGTFVFHQVKQLRELGHNIEVLHILGYRTKMNYVKAMYQVFRLTKNYKFDIVHAHYGLSGMPALFSWKTPVIITFHGSDVLVGKIQPIISRCVAKMADAAITVSQKINSIIPGEIIPCGVDLDVFKPYPQAAARSELGLPMDKKLILFPFNPERKVKRFDVAEAVIKKLRDDGLDIDLLVVDKVSNNKMPLYYSAADAMILCSDSEGSPTSVKEALACNIPVVSTDVGDVKEIMYGVGGTAICKSDVHCLAENLYSVLRFNEKKFESRIYMERYSQKNTALALIAIYKNVIEKKIKK